MTAKLLLAALMAAAAVPGADYVPDKGWDRADSAAFYERWFGGQLRAMGEPPLATRADLAGRRQRFRLTVLPTFEPAFAYRIDEEADGRLALRWARLDGKGGYAPGRLARDGARPLTRGEAGHLRRLLGEARLASQAREGPPMVTRRSGGSQVLTLCVDGTEYVFEHLDVGGRAFVIRACTVPEKPLRRLLDAVIRLGPECAAAPPGHRRR